MWSHAFRTQPAYKIVEETYKMLKHEGRHIMYINKNERGLRVSRKSLENQLLELCVFKSYAIVSASCRAHFPGVARSRCNVCCREGARMERWGDVSPLQRQV